MVRFITYCILETAVLVPKLHLVATFRGVADIVLDLQKYNLILCIVVRRDQRDTRGGGWPGRCADARPGHVSWQAAHVLSRVAQAAPAGVLLRYGIRRLCAQPSSQPPDYSPLLGNVAREPTERQPPPYWQRPAAALHA
jgi:hypothetical protein